MDARLLIVDEHPTVREALRFVFASVGVKQIEEVTTGGAACQAVRERTFDAVLLDPFLSQRNGLDALQVIKAWDPSLPVLIHSYYDNPRLVARCYQLGADDFLVKGEDKDKLVQAVQKATSGDGHWAMTESSRTENRRMQEGSIHNAGGGIRPISDRFTRRPSHN